MNPHSWRRRVAIVLGVALAAVVSPFVVTTGAAWACGCGAYSPEHGGLARVPRETALVRTVGDGTEDVYVSLTLDSDVRTGALLFPVPDRHAVVSAGPRNLFDELLRLTTPRDPGPTKAGNGAGAPGSGVTVENRQTIGPLDVVTLSSGDSGALTAWLQHNGFTAKPALTAAARPYTSAGWAFVAVRLRPGAGSGPLDGRLDPLHLHFASPHVVYPMRLSAMASDAEQVTVFTLGAHSLDLRTRDVGMRRTWAGRLVPADHPELATLTTHGTTFLTRWDGTLTPDRITDDFHFARTARDSETISTPSGQTTMPVTPAGTPAVPHRSAARSDRGVWTGIGIGGLAVVVLGLVVGLAYARRRTGAADHGAVGR